MSPEQFTYWLQGFLEVSGAKSVDAQQLQVIKDHLNLVFEKKTPNYEVLRDHYDLRRQFQQNGPVRQLDPNELLCLKTELSC